jgi:hypothetical protein
MDVGEQLNSRGNLRWSFGGEFLQSNDGDVLIAHSSQSVCDDFYLAQ